MFGDECFPSKSRADRAKSAYASRHNLFVIAISLGNLIPISPFRINRLLRIFRIYGN